MDVSSACAINQAQLGSQISIAVAKKVQDAQAIQGDAAIALIQAAARTGDGQTGIDGRIRQANHASSGAPGLDLYA